jgi:Leucine Rich repeat
MEQQGAATTTTSTTGGIHRCITDAISKCREHKLQPIYIFCARNADRASLEHLADYMNNNNNNNNDDSSSSDGDDSCRDRISFESCTLLRPSDGGGRVLRDLLATMPKVVSFRSCDFGSREEATQLLAALQTNPCITDLTLGRIVNVGSAELGACLSGMLRRNRPTLLLLNCSWHGLFPAERGVNHPLRTDLGRAVQQGLRFNQTLKELRIACCDLGDEGVGFVVNSLSENTTMHMLDISYNRMTSNGLDSITQVLESTQLTIAKFSHRSDLIGDVAAAQRFAHALSRNKCVQDLGYFGMHHSIAAAAACMIFQALESNTTLQSCRLGEFRDIPSCLDQLIASLPRMKGIKLLDLGIPYSNDHVPYLQNAHFLEKPSTRIQVLRSFVLGGRMRTLVPLLPLLPLLPSLPQE